MSVDHFITLQDSWVDRSLILGRIQLYVMSFLIIILLDYNSRVQHFSPDPTMLFSGVVACVTDVRSLRNSFLRALDPF
jgi:hypothetical protein